MAGDLVVGPLVFLPAPCLDSDGILHSVAPSGFVGLLFAGLRRFTSGGSHSLRLWYAVDLSCLATYQFCGLLIFVVQCLCCIRMPNNKEAHFLLVENVLLFVRIQPLKSYRVDKVQM